METYLAIASRREERAYRSDPIPSSEIERLLEAGRVAGSASNRQAWRFLAVARDDDLFGGLARAVTVPGNVAAAQLLILIVVDGDAPSRFFDAGRAAQNIMLAAWDGGIGSSPNTVKDPGFVRKAFGLNEISIPVVLLSFGYPIRRPRIEARSAEEWIAVADRKPLSEVSRRL